MLPTSTGLRAPTLRASLNTAMAIAAGVFIAGAQGHKLTGAWAGPQEPSRRRRYLELDKPLIDAAEAKRERKRALRLKNGL
jgi:hypothetical protein